ncbi:hypothetical protein A2Y85_02185 [candidate division WOR-3 bacterium RBG_13_43_14]|uniref:DNA binding HTH domain-containing protein n=1 Tax=candidate division WOR-3 bacterium RBG_13_43_14 TaxID=1802590 RepID=A0A1F4UFD4_UNCW3|nr:MAG: hypothetical protein A2Y85_02185 [candidate division WOR-3 bacterium RBG_13_43_14]
MYDIGVAGDGVERPAIDSARDDFERHHIIDVLDKTDWRMGEAASRLGIDRSTLFRKMKKYGISR